ncbi:uncharacterized protein A4U43_C09F11310 [Asparagus officinalis]|uniref:Uncharacterized protein n=1 Tax=Asparagus officinalis TaxID=4686 RepID=A0A5P1E6T6_ASPOF|nr:uncharacterized protein A4U43_C09F11310 [Asparagus officinalis]
MISSVPGSISFVVISVGSGKRNVTQGLIEDLELEHDLFSFVAGAPALAPAFAQSLSFDDLQGVESAANSSVSRHPYDSKETDAWSFICSV